MDKKRNKRKEKTEGKRNVNKKEKTTKRRKNNKKIRERSDLEHAYRNQPLNFPTRQEQILLKMSRCAARGIFHQISPQAAPATKRKTWTPNGTLVGVPLFLVLEIDQVLQSHTKWRKFILLLLLLLLLLGLLRILLLLFIIIGLLLQGPVLQGFLLSTVRTTRTTTIVWPMILNVRVAFQEGGIAYFAML